VVRVAKNNRVAAVIPVHNPDQATLARTIDSVGEQDYPETEVVVVDSSPEPLRISSEAVETTTIRRPEAGIGEARREGIDATTAEYIAHMDEDAILLRPDYFSQAVEQLDEPQTAAVGGTVFPLRGNPGGKAIALADKFNPTSLGTHHIVHRAALCSGASCVFPGQGRGEDRTIRNELQQYGQIKRLTDQAALKDLPTTRQSITRDLLVGTVGGALAGAASGWVQDNLSTLLSRARAEVEEDLS